MSLGGDVSPSAPLVWYAFATRTGLRSEGSTMEKLPESLLIDIFELDHGNNEIPRKKWEDDKSTIRSVVRVCKQWNRIGNPILHSKARLVVNDEGGSTATRFRRRLFATLQENVRLRALTRVITVIFADQSFRAPRPEAVETEGVEDVLQLLRWWLPSLRKATICGHLVEPAATKMMWQLSTMPLRDLRISSSYAPVSMAFFFKYFHNVPLKRLAWEGIGWEHDPNRLLARGSTTSPVDPGPNPTLSIDTLRTSGLEHLSVRCPCVSVGTLKLLFDYIRSLRSFEFRHTASSAPHESYTVKGLQQLLDVQADSLRQIAFGHINNFQLLSARSEGDQMLEFRHMPNLEKLSLNSSHVFHLQPGYVAKMVSAPPLRDFIIEYDSEEQHPISSNELDQNRHDWLVTFSTAWSERGKGVRADLNLHLGGYLELLFPCRLSHLDFVPETWPWDYLESAKPIMASHDITLTWEEPMYKKTEWSDILYELKHPLPYEPDSHEDSTTSDEGGESHSNPSLVIDYTNEDPNKIIPPESVGYSLDTTGQAMYFLSLMTANASLIISISTQPSGDQLQRADFMNRPDHPQMSWWAWSFLNTPDAVRKLRAWRWSLEYEYMFLGANGEDLEALSGYVEEVKLLPVVGSRVELHDFASIQEASRLVYEGKGGIGKAVISIA